MNYVFFGNNVPLAERLRKALGTGVIECITLLQMKNTLLPAEEMDYCVFIEKTDPTLNIPAIMHLHKTFQNIYIVLIAPEMTREEGEAAGIQIACALMTQMEDVVDGFYFMVPFNRAAMICRIIETYQQVQARREGEENA